LSLDVAIFVDDTEGVSEAFEPNAFLEAESQLERVKEGVWFE
jgi:hypothetical protein